MNKSTGIAIVVGIAVIVGIIIFQLNELTFEQVSVDEYYAKDGKVPGVVYPDNPQILGPLQINKDKYLLGENVYLIVTGLQPMDAGTIDIFSPNGAVYMTVDFNGEVKPSFKKYFKPQLLKGKNLCDKDDLVGEWKINFRDYEQIQLKFEIIDSILPNQEYQFEDCGKPMEINIMQP